MTASVTLSTASALPPACASPASPRAGRRVFAGQGIVPGLAVVLVGEDPASQVYVRSKGRMTREVGMTSFEHRLPASTDQARR